MSATATALALGDRAPGVRSLVGADGATRSLEAFGEARVLVVVFVGNGCPTVRLYEERLADLHRRFSEQGLQIVLVNSNNGHLSPPDTYERVLARAVRSTLPFPYVKDQDGSLAKACGAICTPHAFAFDGERRLRYRGRIDDSRTGGSVTTHDLEDAIGALLGTGTVKVAETTPFGCAIVW
jgi:peroxiredoxin